MSSVISNRKFLVFFKANSSDTEWLQAYLVHWLSDIQALGSFSLSVKAITPYPLLGDILGSHPDKVMSKILLCLAQVLESLRKPFLETFFVYHL